MVDLLLGSVMDAIVLQLEHVAQCSLTQYGPWHSQDQRYTKHDGMDLREALLQVAPAVAGLKTGFLKTTMKSRGLQTQEKPKPLEDERPMKSPTSTSIGTGSSRPEYGPSSAPSQSTNGISWWFRKTPGSIPSFSLDQTISPIQPTFDFTTAPQFQRPRPSLKRRRAVSDVDGPNTASQGCKKRRLRKEMVTSRLSRPFSVPATHSISRECVASGNKRLLKLAAIMSARRMSNTASTPVHQSNHPGPSSLLRRAAVINRFILSVRSRAAERGDDDVVHLASNAVLLQQDHGTGFVGARFPITSPSAPLPVSSGLCDSQPSALASQRAVVAVETRTRPTSPRPKPTGASCLRLSPSPRARPVQSPEPKSTRLSYPANIDDDEEGLDDQEVAFPTSEHESRYEATDEPDDVYADFGMIFGGGSSDDQCDDDEEQDHYEDYMDDMDGIPWAAR